MNVFTSLVAVQLIASAAFADSPTGFLDIPFGAPVAVAQKNMAAREGVKAESASSERLAFTGGIFAGQPASKWDLTFVGDKLVKGSVMIDKVKKPVYDDLKVQLTKKYGKPDFEKGHNSWETVWEFRSQGHRTIRLEYDYKGKVVVTYSHNGLAKGSPADKKSDL